MVTIKGLFRIQISKMIFFWKGLTTFSKKLHLGCLRRFRICLWHRSLKKCDFKTSNPPWKMEKRFYILYILNKTNLTTKNRSSVLHNLFLPDISIFNDLVIKNDPVKKAKSFFVFKEGVQLRCDQVLVLEDRTFHCKVLRKLYHNSECDILENFNLVSSTS